MAHAQATATTTTQSGGLQEVVVTAARRTQNLQKVSAAVTVVSGAKIAAQGLTNIAQILNDVPSVQATAQPGGFSVDIRGQGGDLPAGSTQGSVALEFDGVYSINSQGTTIGFFDVNRIETLPGPQSTRYGPDADGGVVNVITKDPVIGSKAGNASLTVGNYDLVRAELAQNIPINDVLALRVAGTAVYRSSYFNVGGGNNVGQAGRVKVLYKPNDRLAVKLEYELDHIGGTGAGSNLFPSSPNKVAPYLGDSINNESNPWAVGDYSTSGPDASHDQSHLYQNTLSANIAYQLNDWLAADETAAFVDIVGTEYECIGWPPPSDPTWGPWTTGGPHTCFNVHEFAPFHQYSSETRLHNAPGTKIQWDLGFYHWNYVYGGYGSGVPFNTEGQGAVDATSTNAVFGEVTYPVTSQLRLIAGLRESFDHREDNFGYNAGLPTPDFGLSMHHFDYRAGVEYDLTPHSMEYFTVSTGYRPGGLTALTETTGANGNPRYGASSFGDEVNTAFEIGSKNRFLDNRLQVNVDGFYYIQNGYQDLDKYTGDTVDIGGTPVVCSQQNASQYSACATPTFGLKAHTMGLEGSIRYLLTPSDQINENFTFLQAYFDRNQSGCATQGLGDRPTGAGYCWDGYNAMGYLAAYNHTNPSSPEFFNIAGSVEPHSPKFATTFSYDHDFTLTQGEFVVGGEAIYSSGYYTNPVLTAYGWQPGYILGNVNMSFTPTVGRWSVSAYIRNVSNYAVKESVLPITTLGDPRTFGGTISYHW